MHEKPRDPNERATELYALNWENEKRFFPQPWPELMGEGYATYGVLNLHLPDWFTGRHALRVYQNEKFRQAIEEWAAKYPSKLTLGKYQVTLSWCACCGLNHVSCVQGNACSLGIDFHEWHHHIGRTAITEHNIDSLGQLTVLFVTWCHYLNGLEAIFAEENGYGEKPKAIPTAKGARR